MSPEQKDDVAQRVAASRAACGLPAKVVDVVVLDRVARTLVSSRATA